MIFQTLGSQIQPRKLIQGFNPFKALQLGTWSLPCPAVFLYTWSDQIPVRKVSTQHKCMSVLVLNGYLNHLGLNRALEDRPAVNFGCIYRTYTFNSFCKTMNILSNRIKSYLKSSFVDRATLRREDAKHTIRNILQLLFLLLY